MKYIFLIFSAFFVVGCSLYRPPKSPQPAKIRTFKEKDSLLGYLNEYRKNYDVTYYDLDLKIEPSKKIISGEVQIYFDAVVPVKKMQIDLAERLKIDSILDNNGQRLSYSRNYTAVTVNLKNTIMISGSSKITVYYHGKPQVARKPPWKGGVVWKKKEGKWFCGVACEDDGANIWWPCKDHIKDKADSIKVRYTIPQGHTCVGNGRLVAHEKTFDGFERFTWKTSYPINNYNLSFYIGDYEHFQIDYEHKDSKLKKLDFYVRKENLTQAKTHFQQAVKILNIYEDFFGPYPWWKDGYKLVESPYEGMEHQTAIAYGDKFKNGKYLNYDYIILHETAHEWWGNYVTACDMSDLWIHEGFATYAEMLYEEKTEGKNAYNISYLVNRITTINKRPLVGPRGVFYTNWRDSDIYSKGAVVLHMLRKNLDSDEQFFRIIKRFATEYNEHCVYTEHFMALVNEETGKNYDWFFKQYVFRPEAPELIYSYGTNPDGKTEFRYKWNPENTNDDFAIGISVQIGSQHFVLHPTSEVQKLTISGMAAETALIDQDDYVIFTNDKKL
ncbi:MAG: M1 family metallopeptidase [Crocinitomicaceae bacterium]|nr:M1 family metallopeptidase [Crocinitomicaceae bacterium]